MVRLIHKEDFSLVCRCVELKPDTELIELEKDLCGILLNPACSPDGEPANGDLQKMLESIEKLSSRQMGFIEKLYTFENENAFGETYDDLARSDWLEPTIVSIKTTKDLVGKLLSSFPTKLNKGPRKEKWFKNLVQELADIYILYTGQPVRTNINYDSMKETPKFQAFAEKCCDALRIKVPDSFETKLHRAVGELRKEGKIPRN